MQAQRFASLLALYGAAAVALTLPAPVDLRVESLASPLGLDVTQPILSWVLPPVAEQRGISQAAFRVQVGLTSNLSVPLWDSGQVPSSSLIRAACCIALQARLAVSTVSMVTHDFIWNRPCFASTGQVLNFCRVSTWARASYSERSLTHLWPRSCAQHCS